MKFNFGKGKNIMKTKEELNAIKEEVDALNKKLAELTEEELKQVTGGAVFTGADGLVSSDSVIVEIIESPIN